jgi:hypothetical protein
MLRVYALLTVLAMTVAMALGTSLLGWHGVPITAALFAAARVPAGARPYAATPALAALAAALAWGGFLAAAATGGRLGAVAELAGRVAGAPAAAVVALTLALPAALAWGAAALAQGLVARVRRAPGRDAPPPGQVTLPAPGPSGRPAGADPEASSGSPAAVTP